MNYITTLLKTGQIAAASLLVFKLASAGAQAPHAVDHSQGYKAMSMKDDLVHRSPDIHWPAGFEPEKADLFAHNDLIINASCERVWTHIIDASRWPAWYPNSKDVEIQGGDPVLRDGTVFRWTTFGLAIESKVHEHVLTLGVAPCQRRAMIAAKVAIQARRPSPSARADLTSDGDSTGHDVGSPASEFRQRSDWLDLMAFGRDWHRGYLGIGSLLQALRADICIGHSRKQP